MNSTGGRHFYGRRKAEAPLSYLCNGQVIPDHIMLARTDTVASAIADAARASLAGTRVAR